MNTSIIAMALAGALSMTGYAQTAPVAVPNRPVFELAFSWKDAKGATVTCPVDDVSYIDLVTSNPAGKSGPGTLTFVLDECGQDWRAKAAEAELAKSPLNLVITVKFLAGGVATAPVMVLEGTGIPVPTNIENGNSYAITLAGVTGISAPASDLDAFARGGDRDNPKAFVIHFSSMLIAPKP